MISLEEASRVEWDVIVVGAGPAGSVAAWGLANRGCSVLLIDKSEFPRDKVCGTCLNLQSISVLEGIGLQDVLEECPTNELYRFRLAGWGRRLDLKLPSGVAVSRAELDWALIRRAIAAGVCFLSRTKVSPGMVRDSCRELTLRSAASQHAVTTIGRVIIDASGLGGFESKLPESVSATSRIGLGVHLRGNVSQYEPHTIHMAVGEGGYVGVVRLGTEELNLAASVDPAFLRRTPRPGAAVACLLRDASFPIIPGIHEAAWQGTKPLTRSPRTLGEKRLFRVGDAAGYVEPFTGEGMAWALRGAMELVPIVSRAVRDWRPELVTQWERTHSRIIGRRQRFCRVIAGLLKRPWLARWALRMLTFRPELASPVVRHLNPRIGFPHTKAHHHEIARPGDGAS